MPDILQKYLIPFYQAEGGSALAVASTPELTPAVEPEAAVEPAVEPEPVEPEPVEPAAEPEPAEHGNKGKKPWFLERISQESSRAARAEEQLAAERRAREAAEALATRLQSNPAEQRPVPSPDFDTAVQRAVTQQRMAENRGEIIRNGYAAFGAVQFDQVANMIHAAGCNTDDFLSDVIAVDRQNAHKILANLAESPEVASSLSQMDSRSRIAELTRMSMAKAPAAPPKAAPKSVSKAPAPPPPVEPSTSKVVDWRSDEASEDDFTRGFNEMMTKRAARR